MPLGIVARRKTCDALHEASCLVERGVRLVVQPLHPCEPFECEQRLGLLVDEPLLARDRHGARELFTGPLEIPLLHQGVGRDAGDGCPERG